MVFWYYLYILRNVIDLHNIGPEAISQLFESRINCYAGGHGLVRW